ncbi:50S ribosomal protein L25/general stress protein Ctc [Acuticoccus sp. I52.16.1]|uniref:50S ribosomal protein L25/general stress protein Ctc n=1 Tax=Acuticoccus sp. I52.16.1 TaxID=2928472 RepID=UPI001FD109D0|nr:50S ribosomal protein L25/general stress protein Ctc [Acuticoccus sp. I52.16.1]UOM33458.1 50S ribosomal protein L25/general stress protein Ctc [Acuticoccus sp. I52.16.1]
MAEGFELKADVRERTGKGAARALRRTEMIPAVIYGNNEPPLAIAIPWKQTTLALYAGGFKTHVWSIDVGGKTIQALARDYQRDPVKERLLHVDFLRVTARSRVTVDVPVSFVSEDECPGISQQDGVLNVVAHSVSVEAGATTIPEHIEVSLAGLEIGATIMSDQVTLPSGVTFTHEEAFTIATITAPVEEVVEDEAEEHTEVPTTGDDAEAGEDGADTTESDGENQ